MNTPHDAAQRRRSVGGRRAASAVLDISELYDAIAPLFTRTADQREVGQSRGCCLFMTVVTVVAVFMSTFLRNICINLMETIITSVNHRIEVPGVY